MKNGILVTLCLAQLVADVALGQTTVGDTLATARAADGSYISWHEHIIDQDQTDSKLIGVYASQSTAEEAMRRACLLPGFRESPDGFEISAYETDQDNWTEGFVTVWHGERP